MKMEDVLVLYNEDASAWTDFILNYIGKDKFNLKVSTLCDSNVDLDSGSASHANVKVIVVIVSAGHLNFLQSLDRRCCSYEDLILNAGTTIILLCGIDETENVNTGQQLKERIPHYSRCLKFTHEHYQEMLKMILIKVEEFDEQLTKASETVIAHEGNKSRKPKVCKKPGHAARDKVNRKQSWKFKVIPRTARVEEPTAMVIAFDDVQSWSSLTDSAENEKKPTEDLELLKDPRVTVAFGSSDEILVSAERINSNTFLFHSPEHRAGEVPIKIMMNGDVIGETSITYQSLESDLVLSISQIYMFLLNRILGLYEEHGVLTQGVDQSMSGLFNDEDSGCIPLQAFEQLFALSTSAAAAADKGKSEVDYPTLIHLAARYNLLQFGAKLTDLPDSDSACALRNREGLTPGEMARSKGHSRMVEFFESLSGNQTKSMEETSYATFDCESTNTEENDNPYMTVKDVDNYTRQTKLSCGDFQNQIAIEVDGKTSGFTAKSSSMVYHDQDELVKIQLQVKSQQLSISDAEILFKEWQLSHPSSSSSSSSSSVDSARISSSYQMANKGSKQKTSFVGKLLKKSIAQRKSKGSITYPSSPCISDLFQPFPVPLAANQSEGRPISSSSTRNSLASNSSRDSCISKSSYVSGIETIDDDDEEEEDETYCPLQTFVKRKSSANLEQLEEDLRNPDSQRPPPLPPRRTPQLESTRQSPSPKSKTADSSPVNAKEDEPYYIPMHSPRIGTKSGIDTTEVKRQNKMTTPEVAPKNWKKSCSGETSKISMFDSEDTLPVAKELTGNTIDLVLGPLVNRQLSSVTNGDRTRKISLPTISGVKEKPPPPVKKKPADATRSQSVSLATFLGDKSN